MPRSPKGQKRPVDVIGTAVTVARIATGEQSKTGDGEDRAAVALGRRRGAARAVSLRRARRRPSGTVDITDEISGIVALLT